MIRSRSIRRFDAEIQASRRFDQTFLSSTFEDLRDEREQMIKAVLEMGHIPVGMEMFSAADEEQWNIIARQIEESDYYAVILAHRYGSTTASGLSFTEKEYDYAVAKGVPVLGFVIEDSSPWPAERIDKEEDKRLRLASFKKKVKSKMVNFWSTKDDLHARFSVSLMKAFASHPRVGWIRSNQVAGPEVIRELSRLSAENSQLRTQIGELQLKEQDQEKNQLKEMLETLSKCRTEVYVRKTVGDWGQPISSTLLSIFEAVAPRLLIENSRYNMASDIALQVTSDTKHYPHWPVPDNYLNTWLADLHSLDLVQPSPKKHSVNDKNDYWCLTDLGADLYKHIRRLLLEYGMKSDEKKPEAPEAPEGAPEVGDALDASPAVS